MACWCPRHAAGAYKRMQGRRIKDQFVLRAYQFRSGGNGNGIAWAMPVDADFPEPVDCPSQEGVFLEPPKPLADLDSVMDAVDGDGLPWLHEEIEET
jgi:hypothetical protein